jgi:hypothetical protein
MSQLHDEGIKIIKSKLSQGEDKYKCFHTDHQGVLWFNNRIVVPKDHQIRKQILDEAHLSKFSIHPGSTKIYQDLRQNFWWTRMKREIAKYVSECDTCQRVKASHLKASGCGRTNLNYTGSSTQVLSQGLQHASNGVTPWPVG